MGVKVKPWKGAWWVFVNHQGRRKAKRIGHGEVGKRAAKDIAVKVQARLALGEPMALLAADGQVPTVQAYLTDWLKTYADVQCKLSTAIGYRHTMLRHIFPAFGDRRLSEVSRADIKWLIANLIGQGLKRQTITNILMPLKEAYQHAMDDGLVSVNPIARTGHLTRSKDDPRVTITPLTADEVRTMLDVASQQAPDTLYPVLLCAVRTGMREGELIGLQWGDVDFHGGFLELRRAVVRGKDTSTKTHKIRRVEMTPQLQAVLTRLKEIRTVEAMAAARTLTEHERVFLSQTGEQWADQTLRRAFNRCLNAAGVRHIGLHVLRHTYASLLIQQGAPAKY